MRRMDNGAIILEEIKMKFLIIKKYTPDFTAGSIRWHIYYILEYLYPEGQYHKQIDKHRTSSTMVLVIRVER